MKVHEPGDSRELAIAVVNVAHVCLMLLLPAGCTANNGNAASVLTIPKALNTACHPALARLGMTDPGIIHILFFVSFQAGHIQLALQMTTKNTTEGGDVLLKQAANDAYCLP